MSQMNLVFVLLFALVKNGFGSIDDSEADIFMMGGNVDKNLMDSLHSKLEKDMEVFKELMPDPNEDIDGTSKLILQQVISKEYKYMITKLCEADEFTYMLQLAAIRRLIEAAFEKSTGKVEQKYVVEVMGMIESEVQICKEKPSLENNKLR